MSSEQQWKRLGEKLMQRRIDLGYVRVETFWRDRGLRNRRIVDALENGERSNYAPATIAQYEVAYRVEHGSFAAVLSDAGAELRPLPDSLERYDDLALLDELRRRAQSRNQQATDSQPYVIHEEETPLELLAAERRREPAEPERPGGADETDHDDTD